MSGQSPPCGPQEGDPPEGAVETAIKDQLVSLIFPAIAAIIFSFDSLEAGLWVLAITWSIILSRLPFKIIKARHEAFCEQDVNNPACWAGIVTHVEESFSSGWHILFPWAANHPYLDVVVKRDYRSLVTVDTYYIHCDEVVPYGYILRTYYYDHSVCEVLRILGDGGLGGRLANIAWAISGLISLAIISAIGLVPLAAPLAFLVLTVLLAVLIFLLLAALVGNLIRATNDSTEPTAAPSDPDSDDEVSADQSRVIAEHDLITVGGDVFTHPDLNGANVGWFGQEELTSLHGTTSTTEAPYSNEDADVELPHDDCPIKGRKNREKQ